MDEADLDVKTPMQLLQFVLCRIDGDGKYKKHTQPLSYSSPDRTSDYWAEEEEWYPRLEYSRYREVPE